MTADAELERVVAWLRREAATMTEMSGKTTMTLQDRADAEAEARNLTWLANRLARHEHKETNDG